MIQEGQTFEDKEHLQRVVGDYRIQVGFVIKHIKNDNVKFTASYADPNCK